MEEIIEILECLRRLGRSLKRIEKFLSEIEDVSMVNEVVELGKLINEVEYKTCNKFEFRDWLYKLDDVVGEMEDLSLELLSMKLIKDKKDANEDGGVSFSSMLRKIGLGLGLLKPRDLEIHIQMKSLLDQMDHLLLHNNNLKVVDKSYSSSHSDSFVLGREDDMDAISSLLLSDYDSLSSNVTAVAIVGMGGSGKTTLARRIYNHYTSFPFKAFATVGPHFSKSSILRQLLLLPSESESESDLGYDELLSHFPPTFHGKKYLIVLDDVWSETPSDWHDLFTTFTSVCARGTRLLLTTRSKLVATAIKSFLPVHSYHLPLLSDTDSWLLFRTLAFPHTHTSNKCYISRDDKSANLTDIGKQIMKKCCNLPLAIKLVASSLHGQPESKWLQFATHDSLFTIPECGDKLMSVLKRSYSHLPPSIKPCFTYCAIFPKDYVIKKDNLMAMWIAEDLVETTTHSHPSSEDAAEDYFMLLLNRCLIQVVKKDNSGEVVSCTLHDLMHHLAQQLLLSENDVSPTASCAISVLDAVHNQGADALLPKSTGFRTSINFHYHPKSQLTKSTYDWLSHPGFKPLRVLDLSFLGITNLSPSIGALVNLRYLSLTSNSDMDTLPSSISNLCNLQTLVLRECWNLKLLPSDLTNLTNLQCLDVAGCNSLTHMPPGMHKLTSLHKLPMFVVGYAEGSWDSAPNQLEDLKALSNLKGNLTIRILKGKGFPYGHGKTKVSARAGYLHTKKHLRNLFIQWENSNAINQEKDPRDEDVTLLDDLQPPTNCAGLELTGYSATRFPSWGMENLVTLRIENCSRLQHLPTLNQALSLKELMLHRLADLEYIDDNSQSCIGSTGITSTLFFPSLEKLTLSSLPKLKGWWKMRDEIRKEEVQTLNPPPSLSRLSVLRIRECPRLLSVPFCPNVQELDLRRCDEALPAALVTSSCLHLKTLSLKKLMVDRMTYLNSLPTQAYQLSSMFIHLSDVESLSNNGNDVFYSPLPSLEVLEVSLCSKLRSLLGLGWMHLIALQTLTLSNLPVLDLFVSVDNGVAYKEAMPWKYLTKLRSLELNCLPKLVSLPPGMKHLNSLKTLKIRACHGLKTLPESMGALVNLRSLCIEACTGLVYLPQSMSRLTSLLDLEILRCSGHLRERCERPFGVDWPKIQHIPNISIN